MGLFLQTKSQITLPALPKNRKRIGRNYVYQTPFPGASIQAEISEYQIPGYSQIKTSLNAPFDIFFLRHKNAKRMETEVPVLATNDIDDFTQISDKTNFTWDSLGKLNSYASTPAKVLMNWRNKFIFKLEDDENGMTGLRIPQIGSLHAIAAHFAVGSAFDAATVVLPTGTGKTETMLAEQVYRCLPKTLVIVPSDTLRNQIFRKFLSLGVLPHVGVVPIDIARPYVACIKTGIRSLEEAKALIEASNVIIALPNVLQTSNQDAIEFLTNQCSDLIVDEAHHITASTWASIKDKFQNKRITQFTATPFRRDGKRVDGKIIFNYKLGDAQKAGYYKSINLKTIEEFGDINERDTKIAEEAINILRHDRTKLGLDHLLMARVRSTERALAVCAIYQKIAPEFKPVTMFSGSGRTLENKKALGQLLDRGSGGSRIIVCVDMLGEGFDLSNLKIAALHDTHKSLAITLQFIGRFTRKGAEGTIGDASVVANIADTETETKLANLYAEGADWDSVIKRLSEERIDEELKLQEVVLGLKEHGNLHSQLSLWNLRPPLSTQIYNTTCRNWHPERYAEVLPKDAETWHSINEEKNILVAVVFRRGNVCWGNYQNLHETLYDLIIAWWNKEEKALFIYSSDYNGLRVEKMATLITDDDTNLLNGPVIFNILNNVELPLAKSLGSSKMGAISFTSYFGPNVTEGLASIEKAESELNNIACIGYEDGERVSWGGAKRKGKVWQQKSGSISEWISWCTKTWKKVTAIDQNEPNITKDFLRPQRLSKNHTSYPISVQWGEHAQVGQSDRQFIIFGTDEIPLFLVDLNISDVYENGAFSIQLTAELVSAEYKLTISDEYSGGYEHVKISGPDVFFKRQNGAIVPLVEHLIVDPFIVRYADGTHSYNCYHIPVNLKAGIYPQNKLEKWDWGIIPLQKESMHKECDQDTIQFRTYKEIEADFDLIFNDDGSGEAADLVALKDVNESTIRLCLVHCKGAYEGKISNDIRNFYTVCGQAQKSITVKHAGLNILYLDLKRRHEIWSKEGYTRFLKGDIKKLSYFKEKARRSHLEFEIIIVQPGVSANKVSDDILKLLATTELYLSKTTQAKLRIVVSP